MNENDINNPYWKLPEQGERKEIFYRYDEKEGKIIRTTDSHDEYDRIFIQQAWDNYGERTDEARRLVQAGLKSPIYYHMEKLTMEIAMLAPSVGLPKWRVKRHFKPSVYKKLKRPMLERYARVFEISADDLDKLD